LSENLRNSSLKSARENFWGTESLSERARNQLLDDKVLLSRGGSRKERRP